MRVYVRRELKRTVVVKDDDILSAAELRKHSPEVTKAITEELRTWLENKCFKMIPLKNAQNVMTSRYVAKWKWVKGATTPSRSPNAQNHGNVVPNSAQNHGNVVSQSKPLNHGNVVPQASSQGEEWKKIIRMRIVLRGFQDSEAFSLHTFSGTAKRTSQRTLASEAACDPNWIIASLDIDKAFLKGFSYEELAKATREKP